MTLHNVEAPAPWYPVMRGFAPYIGTFYRDWLSPPVLERADAQRQKPAMVYPDLAPSPEERGGGQAASAL